MNLLQKFNKAVILSRYINVMNRRINSAPMPPGHLVEYKKANEELYSIISEWPKVILENLAYVNNKNES